MTNPITTAGEMQKRCAQIAKNHESTSHNAANACRSIVDEIEVLPIAEPQTEAAAQRESYVRGEPESGDIAAALNEAHAFIAGIEAKMTKSAEDENPVKIAMLLKRINMALDALKDSSHG